MNNINNNDINPNESKEWIESIQYINKKYGIKRAKFIINLLMKEVNYKEKKQTYYLNTIKDYTNLNFNLEKKIEDIVKWNAIIIVLKAIKKNPEIGGHIGTFSSSSTLYEVGFNHFWKGNDNFHGDLIFIQGHSSPGIYARSFLEGRLSKKNINNFRIETNKHGISSYPHPYLMKDYWQFPTVSMGLGPLQAAYNAKFLKYMINRNIIDKTHINRKIWCMCGDGEMDEPEAISAINIAGREKLDNLIFIINCNLQRLDGPVRGNGKIIEELENIFSSNGWFTIKVIWNSEWEKLLKKDKNNILLEKLTNTLDGDYQNYKAHGIKYIKKYIFNTKELKELISDYSDEQLEMLDFGGHDYNKIYSAYKEAIKYKNKPVVILAKTTKGYGLGCNKEASNMAHNIKYIKNTELIKIKNKLKIPINDEKVKNLPFYKPEKNSKEIIYITNKRINLGGYIPCRKKKADKNIIIPNIDMFEKILNYKKTSTITTIVKIISLLCSNDSFGKYIIPIVPDEARTFGMETLFKQIKIYSQFGQLYKPVDSKEFISYEESKSGQLLQEGINEAGAFCSWLAAATSYSTNNKITLPFYLFYSMFGFQRITDLIWAAADSMAKGFLIGTIAGKTSLPGEGLQHCDGNSQIIASLIPNCISYDLAFNYEVIIVIHYGLKQMFQEQKNIFFYITTYNDINIHPNYPNKKKIYTSIIKGIYCFKKSKTNNKNKIELLGSGNILFEVIEAANILENDFKISVNIWSVTSFTQLARNGRKIKRWNNLNPKKKQKQPYITKCFKNKDIPVIAVTDYAKIYAEQIREFINNNYSTLGTDGFGISDTRENLKTFFEINKYYIILNVLNTLKNMNNINEDIVEKTIKKYKINLRKKNPENI